MLLVDYKPIYTVTYNQELVYKDKHLEAIPFMFNSNITALYSKTTIESYIASSILHLHKLYHQNDMRLESGYYITLQSSTCHLPWAGEEYDQDSRINML